MTIHLQNLEFFAYHGLYEEEKILGNTFIVNVKIDYNLANLQNITIANTVNYEEVFTLVRQIMKIPTELLETLVVNISTSILNTFLQVEQVYISVYKQNPPIASFQGNVGIELNVKR